MDSEKSDVIFDEEERRHYARIIKSFKCYHYYATERVAKSLAFYHQLPEKQKSYLDDFEEKIKHILKCVDDNQEIINSILEDVDDMFETVHLSKNKEEIQLNEEHYFLRADVDRVVTTLKQIRRDWSIDGKNERDQCYLPIINDLKNLFKNETKPEKVSVLVPGAGLGRLAFEIAMLGFKCQGNELSLHMLITSNFILNKCTQSNLFKIYPFVNQWSNNMESNNQTKATEFPDICPFDFEDRLSQFSMTAGDFLQIYNENNEWSCVVTCYFIDTAHNVIDYMEKIWNILAPGGYWINFGPLLYHFSDLSKEKSIELSYSEIKKVINKIGFKYLKEETNVKSTYLNDEQSMLKYVYDCIYFIVQKPHTELNCA